MIHVSSDLTNAERVRAVTAQAEGATHEIITKLTAAIQAFRSDNARIVEVFRDMGHKCTTIVLQLEALAADVGKHREVASFLERSYRILQTKQRWSACQGIVCQTYAASKSGTRGKQANCSEETGFDERSRLLHG